MMRVALVAGSFAPREWGAERQMRAVLAGLAGAGSECHVVTQRVGTAPRRQVLEGIVVHRVGSLWAFRFHARVGMATFLIAAVAKTLWIRPKRLVSLQLGSASAAASLVSRLLGVRHVVRLTGGGSNAYRSEAFARRAHPIGRWLTTFITNRNRATLVAPAEHLIKDFVECFPECDTQTLVIPNGVEEVCPPANLRRRDGVVWYARNGSEQSTVLFLAIARSCPEVRFKVIGAKVDEELPSNVVWLGWVDQPMVLMWESKALLNTSQSEGSPNTALQALATGCRVVGQENAGMREIQDRYPAAVSIFERGGVDEAATLLRRALAGVDLEPAAVVTAECAQQAWRALLAKEEQ